MKTLNIRIQRNQALDIIRNLKILLSNFDNKKLEDKRYLMVPILSTPEYQINVVIDRQWNGIEESPAAKVPFYKKLFIKKG